MLIFSVFTMRAISAPSYEIEYIPALDEIDLSGNRSHIDAQNGPVACEWVSTISPQARIGRRSNYTVQNDSLEFQTTTATPKQLKKNQH